MFIICVHHRWKNQLKAIVTVLKNFGADFLCIQELDESDFYKANLKTDGYSSIYIQKSGQKRDGCGIFYKDNRVELLVEDRIEHNVLVNSLQDENISCGNKQNDILAVENEDADPKNASKKNTLEDCGGLNDPYVRLKCDYVGIVAVFRLKGPFFHVVIVANTHLYWDPKLVDVKLVQAKYLLSRLAQFKTLVSERYECAPSVFLAGDFNSVSNDKVSITFHVYILVHLFMLVIGLNLSS
ncbi:hypothetical protein Pint_07792 [Pistacia integerrima]|uniref:Uncharacterized protein n=1 Tax=Pistacia integerrima TaxID=434235 RepID=A0ACC0XRY4_9ROSI|nr:hypothetical protein Pint_07792 [Pistacia integerrima]